MTEAQQRIVHTSMMATPGRWPTWPFLCLMRPQAGQTQAGQMPEIGVLFDARAHLGLTGYSATVFLRNIFTPARSAAEILAGPREVYDTCEEIYAAGWRVD